MGHALIAPAGRAEPFGEMNTTPLIDVMLVLLVMFILAVPTAVHQVPIDLPAPSPSTLPRPILAQNVLTIDARGQIAWNGAPMAEGELFAVLQQAARIKPEPLVRLAPAGGTPYGATARVLRLIKLAQITAFAFVDNEQYASFGKAPAQPLR